MSGVRLGWAAQVAWTLRKDLALEARLRLRLWTVPAFAAMVLLLFSFAAGAEGALLTMVAPAALWLAVLLASTLLMNEGMRLELEDEVHVGLWAQGMRPSALFVGKAVGNAALLALLVVALAPVGTALFGLTAPASAPWTLTCARLALVAVAGTLAVAAPGTLLAAMAHGPRRALVVPLMSYPLVVPALLAAVRATAMALSGEGGGGLWAWLSLLIAFNLVYWPLCALLFAHVIEEP